MNIIKNDDRGGKRGGIRVRDQTGDVTRHDIIQQWLDYKFSKFNRSLIV